MSRRGEDDVTALESTAVLSGLARFDDFYRGARERLYRALSLAIRNHDLAAEATDEAMTRAYERWSEVSRYDNPAGWVYRVAHNWAVSRLRTRGRETAVEVPERAVDPEELADPQLSAALHRLSVNHRAVVVMRYYLDWSVQQMAEVLEVPTGTVKSRLSRALDELNDVLSRNGVER